MEEAHYVQNYPPTQDSFREDEVIDTLSLSDFVYDDNGNAHDFYRVDDRSHNLDVDDQFEFSSELLKTSANNNVVFCGKIIPYREDNASQNAHKLESKKQQKHHKQRWSFFRIFRKSSISKPNLDSEKLDLKYKVPIRRVSILASGTKSKWYFLMFGFGSSSFSTQVHIRDLKKRQSSMGTKDGRENKMGGGGIGSWRLVRLLGCGGGGGGFRRGGNHLPNAMMEIG